MGSLTAKGLKIVKIYKFVDTNFGISNIALQRLKVSRLNELNDPFELLAADLLDSRHRKALSAFKEQLNETNGLVCFSGSWSNPLLWGHYANKHNGIALGFEVPDDCVLKVKYTTQRAKVEFDLASRKVVDGNTVIDKLIRTKFIDWSYEDEYRIFVNLSELEKESGNYFINFSPELRLTDVILGMKSELTIARLQQLLGEDRKTVRICRAGMALRQFKIIEDRAFRVQRTRVS